MCVCARLHGDVVHVMSTAPAERVECEAFVCV
jgi:hypothetical protein